MRTIVFLLLFFLTANLLVSAQTPSKSEMQKEMKEAVDNLKKEIAEKEKEITAAKAGKEDASVINDLQEELEAMKKQLKMIEGVGKDLSNMSDKIVQQASEEELVVPKKDVARISSLPKKILTETELSLFIKNVHADVEKLIPAAEKTEALKIYNETKTTYKTNAIVANAASGCWMLGHWEKALFIMGKACIDDITDADNLNNYAAFLIMSGGEQAALPILEYLNEKYPNNSTILNNIGQAWFGLGEIENAKKYLEDVTKLYPNHSMANFSLSNISLSQGDKAQSISFLKASLKESYDPEKDAALAKLGYKIKFADMPPFNYPMKKDPFGLIPLLNSWTGKSQSSVEDGESAFALQRYLNGVDSFKEQLVDEDVILSKKLSERAKSLTFDAAFTKEFLEPYNCPAYLQAGRSVQLLAFETKPGPSPLITQLWLPFQKTFEDNGEIALSIDQILQDCEEIWYKEVVRPIGILSVVAGGTTDDCKARDAEASAYLAKRSEIYNNGVELIKNEFIKKSKRLDAWILLNLYSIHDQPPKTDDDYTYKLVSNLKSTIGRKAYQNKLYERMIYFIDHAKIVYDRYRSDCDKSGKQDPQQKADNLNHHKVEVLECEYNKVFDTPIRYRFELRCNTLTEKTDPKLPKRKPDIQKGSAQNSSRKTSAAPPLHQASGPSRFLDAETEQESNYQQGPLTAENKTISQCTLEYNKWGNLVGLNFQLNEDGTALKDPESIESGVDSRWSWNAIASPKKGYMNKLLMK